MRGRHAAELTHALARTMRAALARARTTAARRSSGSSTRSISAAAWRASARASSPPTAGWPPPSADRAATAPRRLRDVAGRLESLSPLAVLAAAMPCAGTRDRTRIVRDAAEVPPGDRVRVTLARGELACARENSQR